MERILSVLIFIIGTFLIIPFSFDDSPDPKSIKSGKVLKFSLISMMLLSFMGILFGSYVLPLLAIAAILIGSVIAFS